MKKLVPEVDAFVHVGMVVGSVPLVLVVLNTRFDPPALKMLARSLMFVVMLGQHRIASVVTVELVIAK